MCKYTNQFAHYPFALNQICVFSAFSVSHNKTKKCPNSYLFFALEFELARIRRERDLCSLSIVYSRLCSFDCVLTF